MIPDIKELNFPKIDEKQYATLTHATANLADMGEKTITTQVKIDGEIVPDFSYDWAVEFQGDKYIMPLRIPQGAKGNDSLNSQIDLSFQHWAIYQLKRWPFVTIQQIAAGTYLPDEEVATVSLNLKDFCILFGQVLEYYYGGAITIDFNDDPVTGWKYKQEATVITISHTKIWNVLIDAFHDKYGVRWEIKSASDNSNTVKGGERYVIRVGYPTTEVDHIFEYGFEGGLLKVGRQVQSEEIRNILKGRGGETNIPFRYFKDTDPNNPDFRPDPDWVEELANIYFPNLMPATFRSYVQGWKAAHISKYPGYKAVGESNAYAPWAYRKGYTDTKFSPVEFVADEITIDPEIGDRQVEILPGYSPYVKKGSSLDKYGALPDTLDNNDDIYPTLQGTGLDIAVAVEQIESDDVAESTKSDAQTENISKFPDTVAKDVQKGHAKAYDASNRRYFSVDSGKNANITGYAGVKAYNPQKKEDKSNLIAELDYTIKVFNATTGVQHSASGIPPGSWYFTVEYTFNNTSDETLDVTCSFNSVKVTSATPDTKWRNTFDIWVKNVWNSAKLSTETEAQYSERVWKPVLGDREGNKAKIVFTSGALAISEDYEFTIVDFPVRDTSKTWKDENGVTHTSHWRIKLAKSEAELEATGLYVPSTKKQGAAGDTFVFIGTEMMHNPYVTDAEIRLADFNKDQLGEKKEVKPTAVVTTDRVRLNNEGKPNALINQLRVGNSLRLFDKRFFNEEGKAYETLYLQSITYTYREPTSDDTALNPDVEIVLGNEYTTSANPVSMMQGEISALQRQVGAISNIEQIVRAVGDKLYLRKDGISDRSLSPTAFGSLLTSLGFRNGIIGGQGWGFFKDESGRWVLEVDSLNVRTDLQVNNLVINQVTARGGMTIESAASLELTEVYETSAGYECHFDQKQGTVSNLFKVGDVAMSMVFDDEWHTDSTLVKFYKRRVMAVSEGSVTLSKTIANGSGVPMAKDVIVQYGSYTDPSRRYVVVRDVVNGGYERFIEGLDSVDATGQEYFFVGRQAGMYNNRPRWYIGDDKGYIEWINGELNIKGRINTLSTIDDKPLGEVINDRVVEERWLFVLHTSQTAAPALPALGADGSISDYKGWSADAPAQQSGKYIWSTLYVRKGDGTASLSDPVCIQGHDGKDGVTLTSEKVEYAASASGTVPPAAGWQTSIPTVSNGNFLWTRVTTVYSDGDDTVSYSVSYIPENGEKGDSYSPNLIVEGDKEHRVPSTSSYRMDKYLTDGFEWKAGDELTISACISVGDDDDGIRVEAGNGDRLCVLKASAKNQEEVVTAQVKITWIKPDREKDLRLYAEPYIRPPFSTNTYVKWMVVQRGHTDGVREWIPAASEMKGTQVKSKSVTYAKTASATQPADSAFTYTSIGALNLAPGDYMWVKTTVEYSDGTTVDSYSVSRIGSDGSDGLPGAPGADGKSTYVHYAYANSPYGTTDFSTTYFPGALYVGVCTNETQGDPTDPIYYEWARLKGEDGVSAQMVTVNSDAQVFSYEDDFATLLSPTEIHLTATVQGIANPTYQWSYKLPGQSAFTIIAGATSSSYALAHNSAIWGAGTTNKSITLRCTSSGGMHDEVTIAKVSSGSNGTDGNSYSENLLLNSALNGDENWVMITATLDNKHVLGERGSAKASAAGLTENKYYGLIQTVSSSEIGVTYTGSIWVYTENPSEIDGGVVLSLYAMNEGEILLTESVGAKPTKANEWQQFHVSITLPAGTTRIRIRPFLRRNGTVWFSSPKLEKGDNPNPVWTPNSSEMVGTDGYTVVLTNESHIFEGDTDKALPGFTECGVIAYKGATQVAAELPQTVSGLPTGMTYTPYNSGTTAAKFRISVTSALTAEQGEITVPVTVDGKTFNKVFSWSLSLEANSIVSITEEYYLSDSRNTTTGGTWQTSRPVWQPDKYIWTRLHIVYTDGSEAYQGEICNAGADGFSYAVNMLAGAGRQLGPNTTYRLGLYDYAEVPVPGKTYTLTMCYKVGSKDDSIRVFADAKGYYTIRSFTSKVETIEKYTFVCPSPTNSASPVLSGMSIYHSPNDSDFDGTDTYVKWAVLVEGDNPAKVWVPSAAESSAGVNELSNSSFATGTEHWRLSNNIFWDGSAVHSSGGMHSVMWDVASTSERVWRGIEQGTFAQTSSSPTAANPNKARTDVTIETHPGECWTASVFAYCENRNGLTDPLGTVPLESRARCEIKFYSSYGKEIGNEVFSVVPSQDGDWQRFHLTAVAPEGAAYVGIFCWLLAGGQIWMAKPMLSRGTALSVWSPSPHDTDYLIRALQNSGTIDGGLILASLINLGYRSDEGIYKVMSGLNGIYNSGDTGGGAAFWGGGKMQSAAEYPDDPDSAAAMIFHNGTAYFSRNAIRFTDNAMEVGDNVLLSKDGLEMDAADGKTTLQVANVSVGNNPTKSETVALAASWNPQLTFRRYKVTHNFIPPLQYEPVSETFFEMHLGEDWNSGRTLLGKTLQKGDTVEMTFRVSLPREHMFDGITPKTVIWVTRMLVSFGYQTADGTIVTLIDNKAFDVRLNSEQTAYVGTGKIRLTLPETTDKCWVSMILKEGTPNYNTASWSYDVEESTSVNLAPACSAAGSAGRLIAERTILGNDGLIAVWGNSALLVNGTRALLKRGSNDVTLTDDNASLHCGSTSFVLSKDGISYRIGSGEWKSLT